MEIRARGYGKSWSAGYNECNEMWIKKIKTFILISIIVACLFLAGCNYMFFDTKWTFNYAIINLGGEYQKIKVKKWKDYEGEQLQIIDPQGNVYLTSSYNCTLIYEKEKKDE